MTKLFAYQEEGVQKIEEFGGRALLADSMGCISGDAIIQVNRAALGKRMKLVDLYHKYNGITGRWDQAIPVFCRALCGKEFRQHRIVKILDKGVRNVVSVTLESGKALTLTPDHEVLTEAGDMKFKEISKLEVSDVIQVKVDGTPIVMSKSPGRTAS